VDHEKGAAEGRGSRSVATQLASVARVHVHELGDGLDPDDLSDSELRAIVARYMPTSLASPRDPDRRP
jgi:hypothetical protein